MPQENMNEEKRGALEIVPVEFDPFEPTKAEKFITTCTIAKKLNARLAPIFQDYKGCFIEPFPNGMGLAVSLQFRQLNPNSVDQSRYLAFSMPSAETGGSLAARTANVRNGIINGRKFFPTEACKALKFLFQKPDKVDWTKVTKDAINNMGSYQETISVIVGIDFNRVCEYIFGSGTGTDAGKIFYRPTIMSPVLNGTSSINNWVINLEMMTQASTERMCNEIGFISTGSVNCITDCE